jgi:hypothetical protein
MTAKSMSMWCAGALVVGGMFLMDGKPSWAVEPFATGQGVPAAGEVRMLSAPPGSAMPVPNAAVAMVTTAPAAPSTVPAPATHPPMESVPPPQGTTQGVPSPGNAAPGDAACTEEDECAQFVGATLCSLPGKYWLRADYLAWWTSGTRLPPLVTTSPAGTSVEQAGVLGAAGTTVLFGGTTVGTDMRSGFRTTMGMWLDCCHKWSVEFEYLSLGERSNDFGMFSAGSPILARPLFNVDTNAQASQLVAFPGIVQGAVTADARTYFQGAGVTFSRKLCCCDSCESCDCCESCGGGEGETCGGGACCCTPMLHCCRTDLLIGFRYYNLSDFVGVNEDLTVVGSPSYAETVSDNFRSRNDFYGSEIGLRTQIYRGRWSFEVLTKVAMGNNHQTITINGQTTKTPLGGTTQTYDAGVLAGPSNSGVYQKDQFTVIPQLGLELGYQLSCHWRTYIGFDLMYWGAVARAADQIDLNFDPHNLPPITAQGLPFPQFPGKTDAFWAEGLHLGLERRF